MSLDLNSMSSRYRSYVIGSLIIKVKERVTSSRVGKNAHKSFKEFGSASQAVKHS